MIICKSVEMMITIQWISKRIIFLHPKVEIHACLQIENAGISKLQATACVKFSM